MPNSHPKLDMSALALTNGNQVLTGKQEHYLKRELISRQVKFEINELNTPTALQRFGAPFQSPLGEVSPVDSELPILRYIFVNHVRNFPFLDQAREKEFWQDRLQVFLESFAMKQISSSEDRLEETKRRKIALKCEKLVELMMNSGIPTASGYEERVSFDEIEAAGGSDRNAQESALLANVPEGHWINGWDINVTSVRQTSTKRTVRYHTHAEFLLRVKQQGKPDIVVGRRYGAFKNLHRQLRNELPGKVFPPVPRKIKVSQTTSYLSTMYGPDDADSISSVGSTASTSETSRAPTPSTTHKKTSSLGASLGFGTGFSLSRNPSRTSLAEPAPARDQPIRLWRENQRISLRAFTRQLLDDKQISRSLAMTRFLLDDPIQLNEEEKIDEERRRAMDEIRLEEQRQFYEVAQKRARELDVYMESFRRDIIESNGLTRLFGEIRKKDKLADLDIRYRKFAEWLRIEVAATIYHIFLAEDNSAEIFAQAKRIHSLIPYTILKNIIRIANPAAVMTGVLDLFLATPFKSRSLMQRVLGMALGDGIKHLQSSVDSLVQKIEEPVYCEKLKAFTLASDEVKDAVRKQAEDEGIDLVVVILESEDLGPPLETKQTEKVFNAFVAYISAVDNIDDEIAQSAQYFAYLKQLLKLYTRQRDKQMMQAMIEEPVTLQLFRDLFGIFYEPLVRVYKSANVYNSITDFAVFVDDMFGVIEKAQSQDMATDPNQTVQAFIDLCSRHEENFYKFVHEVHIHDDGLFVNIMGWLEEILVFLRHGPSAGGKLDMNALFEQEAKTGTINAEKAKKEIDALIDWQARRRKWHQNKTREKMASSQTGGPKSRDSWSTSAPGGISPRDFGISDADLADLAEVDNHEESDDEDEEDESMADPILTARKKRQRHADHLKARSGEPQKPSVEEIYKLGNPFLNSLRKVLAN